MSNALSRLLKVLTLERKQGYRNKAVIGGLDKFASRWEADARAECSNADAVNEIVTLMLGYPAVGDLTARERIVDQIIHRTEEIAKDTAGVPAGATAGQEEAGPSVSASPQLRPDSAAAGVTSGAPPEAKPTRPIPHAGMADGIPAGVAKVEGADACETPDGDQASEAQVGPVPASSQAVSAPRITTRLMPPQAGDATAGRTMPAANKPEMSQSEQSVKVAPPLKPGKPGELPEGQSPRPGTPTGAPAGRGSGLDVPVMRLPGVGPSLAERLARLGVSTVRDLLYLLPHRYEDYSSLRTIDRLRFGEEVTVIGTVWDIKTRIIGDNRKIVTAVVGDGSGEMMMSWFNPYVERRLRSGRAYTFSGKVESFRDRKVMRNPEFEPLEVQQVSTGRLVPVYPLTEGISARWLRRIMKNAVDAWATDMQDPLPPEVRRDGHLMPLGEALTQIHFPDNQERLAAAHRRLSFDEFFTLQLGVLGHRQRFREMTAKPLRADSAVLAPFLRSLPFPLTAAQQQALRDIAADLTSVHPMNRLLQGDVGSGKTAVAAVALWAAVANGTQGAIMAPTEILAEQHTRSFGAMFANLTVPAGNPTLPPPEPQAQTCDTSSTDYTAASGGRPVRVALLTGSVTGAERQEALAALAAGEIDIAVGTHALIQEGVVFHELTVAVVDEQHRFGVEQRSALRQKGLQPHMLVMSATPIPRSLALTIYGDLDVSVIDEMPAGRIPIKTKWLTSSQRERAFSFIRRQVESGRQAFIIYPLVEEGGQADPGEAVATPKNEAKAAVEEHARLSQMIFPDLRVGLLHGRMKGDEKDRVMRAFDAGELDVLVATSVVEVGIDVPNATVMMIENADRFGLAQLHQFRGRVGRGEYPSYCILISDAEESGGVQRLQALENSTDGFALAQVDLEMRGPGDFFGTRQSGLPPLRTAQLGDLPTLEAARAAAQKLFAADPGLGLPEHQGLAAQVAALWAGVGDVS
jgi:ATP-dependent DNA helicase RecG